MKTNLAEMGYEEQVMTRERAEDVLARPRHPRTWWGYTTVASALNTLGRGQEAEILACKAIKLERNVGSLMNLSFILHTLGRYHDALPLAREAYECDHTNRWAATLYGEMLLRFEEWDEGWRIYEQMFWDTSWGKFRLAFPIWNGESLKGKRIGVPAFEGFGDAIMFFRWTELLHAIGAKVVFYCKEEIAPLFEGHKWLSRVLPIVNSEVYLSTEDFDYFLPLVAMPNRFNVSRKPFPWSGPYLPVHPKPPKPFSFGGADDTAAIQRLIKPKVGLCTKAGEHTAAFSTRTLSAEQKAKILAVDAVDWVSLEYGENPELKNWADTARIMEDLDLVVSVDTGVLHLAGAMGKKAWGIIPGGLGAAWFGVDRTDSVWYPSIRIFRNPEPGLQIAVDSLIRELRTVS